MYNMSDKAEIPTGSEAESQDSFSDEFESKSSIEKHHKDNKTGKSSTPHSCSLCKKKFKARKDLTIHLRIHTGEKPFSCDVCGKCFTQKHQLIDHTFVHTKERPHECTICKKGFAFKGVLKRHYVTHSKEELKEYGYDCSKIETFHCEKCNKTFNRKSSLTNHIYQKHTTEKPVTCTFCNKSFAHENFLKSHLWIHSEREKKHTCNVCGMSYYYSTNLKRHLRKHADEKTSSDKEFQSMSEINNKKEQNRLTLLADIHYDTNENIYSCTVCRKTFLTHEKCFAHCQIHNAVKLHSCGICGARFGYQEQLRSHHLLSHFASLSIHCDQCDKVFKFNANLKKHKLAAHGQKKPLNKKQFPCLMCNKKFTTKRYLNVHYRIHTRERPYKCDICSKGFSTRILLNAHLRVHTSEKPYVCDMCGKSYKTLFTLKTHTYTHSNLRLYLCHLCDRNFLYKSNLTRHYRVTHEGLSGKKCKSTV